MELIFEKTRAGRRGIALDALDVPEAPLPAELVRAQSAPLPEVSELDVVRHFTRLSQRNFGVDSHFYPLGSCTMKYNPKMAEAVAANAGFHGLHPHLASSPAGYACCQGAFEVVYETERLLSEISGMRAVSLQPMAGAHGELTGVLLIAAYHRDKGNRKDTIIIPDSAHGTNPASAAIAGFKVVQVPSAPDGTIHLDSFRSVLDENVAGVMLTCPNTHGLFEPEVRKIADLAHEADALLYYDGANLNAIIGQCRPGDLGFDVMHFNLHKTFATPHGMGGPGSGPVGVGEKLEPYLPGPRVVKNRSAGVPPASYKLATPEKSIGRVAPFFGNFMIALRAYAYILAEGGDGLREVSRNAVLNANYLLARLKEAYKPAFPSGFMHECVLTLNDFASDLGVHAIDLAKALLDRGYHAPTVYFPLTVKESVMIEPTETESKQTLDEFADALLEIAALARENAQALHDAPQRLPVGRLDEVKAARELNCACI
jgi:glycine dehydrogenase subunit 2